MATTVRLWLKRRRLRRIHLIVLVLVAALAAGGGVALAQRTSKGQAGRAPRPAVTAGSQAAQWVAGQVSRSVTVACDPAMCTTLQQQGFPAGNLAMLRPGAPDLRDAGLIVATAALRSEFGSKLASWDAPVVLASFGTGSAAVEIRAIAPDGPAAYLSQLRADVAARKSVGTELLRNPAIEASAPARQQLAGGRVDSRLIAALSIMATMHRMRLVSFGDSSPGASPGVPLRSAVVSAVTASAAAGTAALDSLRALLLMQQPSYRPASIQVVRLPAGLSALRIMFAAPGPLGLLDTSQPLVKISSP